MGGRNEPTGPRIPQVDWRFAYMVADDAIELRHTNRLNKHCQIRAYAGPL